MTTKTIIGVQFKVEGFHSFPKAKEMFGEDVEFLGQRHRHQFGVLCEFEVFHDDRDKEFILLKREIQDYIKRNYGEPAEFRSMSCESIARDIFEAYDAEMVQVDEDGENYAKIAKTK